MYRNTAETDRLQALIYQSDDIVQNEPRFFAAPNDFAVVFDDRNTVVLDMTENGRHPHIFNVYINDQLTKTCIFREKDGILMHIFKEKDWLRVAPSGDSSCISTETRDYKKIEKRKRDPSPLVQ